MVLTLSQYENMTKKELIQELTDINSSFVTDINMKLSNLSEKFNEFLSKYKIHSELQQSKQFNSHLLTQIIQLECNAVTNSQYSRRETIELNPVPADITEDILDENICKALSLTGVNDNLHTCHQMEISDILKNSIMYKCKNLGNKSQECSNIKLSGRLFVSESMSYENQQLAY